MKQHVKTMRALALLAGLAPAVISTPSRAAAQGCEPIRFTTPVDLGGEGQAYQPKNNWQVSLGYRRLFSNEFFVGTRDSAVAGPNGAPPIFKIHTVVAGLSYAINDRFRVSLNVPMSSGSVTRLYADKVYHTQRATGIGDINVSGDAWLLTPRTHRDGNIGFGLGVKAPTGAHKLNSKFYSATGTAIDFPADQPVQPGDGGWAVMASTNGFRRITERIVGFASGSYMMSPKAHSDVQQSPTNKLLWSVPDVYSARLGGAFALWPERGISMSLAGRLDGIPVRDLFGGGDDSTVKRSSQILYADPGLSVRLGRNLLTLSVPYRLAVNRKKSLFEQATPTSVNGGGFAKYLVFVGYAVQF